MRFLDGWIRFLNKFRFTDFLVFEVDQENNVVHLKNLGLPESSDKPKDTTAKPASETAPEPTSEATEVDSDPHSVEQPKTNEAVDQAEATDEEPWPARFSTRLEPLLSERALLELKEMFLQGPNPPQIKSEQPSGSNGSGQSASVGDLDQTPGDGVNVPEESSSKSDRNAKRGRGGRGRGGRGGGRERKSKAAEDNRKVITDVSVVIYLMLAHPTLTPSVASSIQSHSNCVAYCDSRIDGRKTGHCHQFERL